MIRCQSRDARYGVAFSNGRFEGVCDATPDKGGAGQGFRPHELLEAALGSCTAMMLRMYADNHDIPLESATVEVTLDRRVPETATFVCRIALTGNLTPEQRKRLLRAARACPVRRTLSGKLLFVEDEAGGPASSGTQAE
ncbi:MAG TPA: OsmC family protein [Solidesulfovibrio sp.]|jgi:putative redox protein|nr:disulfide bond formation regulator [Desulfovibrio sp.]HML59930.1 OsmC family protein [Solidesulfovibrio sp.]